MINYRSGDHVHRTKPGSPSSLHLGGHNPEIFQHGVVASHSHLTAKVNWEDGSKSTHLQSSGTEYKKEHDFKPIRHSRSSLNIPNSPRVSNEDHKKMLHDEHMKQMKSHEDLKKLGLR
jgi:hypothetical protein